MSKEKNILKKSVSLTNLVEGLFNFCKGLGLWSGQNIAEVFYTVGYNNMDDTILQEVLEESNADIFAFKMEEALHGED